MKLIEEWFDSLNQIHNYLYELQNKTRVVISVNPASIDFNLSVLLLGGSYFEKELNVPQGTSHFLEHILWGNPNKVFKTKKELTENTFGDRNKSGFFDNATTTAQFLYFYTHGNEDAAERMINHVKSALDFPLDKIQDYIEKERKIIIGEIHGREKDERNASLLFNKSFYKKTHPEFCKSVLGTIETVNKITANDLKKFYHSVIDPRNAIITIQTSKLPSQEIWNKIEELGSIFRKPTKQIVIPKEKPISTKFRTGFMDNKDNPGTFLSFNYFYKIPKEQNYTYDVLIYLWNNLIWKVGHDYLREKKNLIYDLSMGNSQETWDYKLRGYNFSCNNNDLLKILDECYRLNTKYWKEFLKSKDAKSWFEDQLSIYIFPRTTSFSITYAENLGTEVLSNAPYKEIYEKKKEAALKINLDDLYKFTDRFFSQTPALWVISNLEKEEFYKTFKKSLFYKKYKTL